MLTFRTTSPVGYTIPTVEEMREYAAKIGLKRYSTDLVADLSNIAAGGYINAPSTYIAEVYDKCVDKLSYNKDTQYYTCYNTSSRNRQECLTSAHVKMMHYHQRVTDFVGYCEVNRFPGNNPMEKAMSLLKLLSDTKGESAAGSSVEGEPLPIFSNEDVDVGEVSEKLSEIIDNVESLSKEELDMVDNQDNDHNTNSGDFKSELSKLKIAQDLLKQDKALMLEISRKLDQFSKLQVFKREFIKVDPAGEEERIRPIEDLSEINQLDSFGWVEYDQLPDLFLYHAVTGQLDVTERITREDKKQAIFILVDGSGSMNGTRHYKATGVVMNRLKSVLKGNSEVFISVFDTEMSKPEHAFDVPTAKALIKKFADGNFKGGGTNISAAVKAAHKYITELIDKGKLLYKPEIVVLTDDDSSASGVSAKQIPGTTVHGFAMDNYNPELKRLCETTNGLFFPKF